MLLWQAAGSLAEVARHGPRRLRRGAGADAREPAPPGGKHDQQHGRRHQPGRLREHQEQGRRPAVRQVHDQRRRADHPQQDLRLAARRSRPPSSDPAFQQPDAVKVLPEVLATTAAPLPQVARGEPVRDAGRYRDEGPVRRRRQRQAHHRRRRSRPSSPRPSQQVQGREQSRPRGRGRAPADAPGRRSRPNAPGRTLPAERPGRTLPADRVERSRPRRQSRRRPRQTERPVRRRRTSSCRTCCCSPRSSSNSLVHIIPMVVGVWMSLLRADPVLHPRLVQRAVRWDWATTASRSTSTPPIGAATCCTRSGVTCRLHRAVGRPVLAARHRGRGAACSARSAAAALLRTLFLTPYALPVYAAVITWSVHVPAGHRPGEPRARRPAAPDRRAVPFWLIGDNSFWASLIVSVWRTWPFAFLCLMAGLQNIPGDLYEAAAIDGAGFWQQIRLDHPADAAPGQPGAASWCCSCGRSTTSTRRTCCSASSAPRRGRPDLHPHLPELVRHLELRRRLGDVASLLLLFLLARHRGLPAGHRPEEDAMRESAAWRWSPPWSC